MIEKENGFSLVEAVVAMVILSASGIVLATWFSLSMENLVRLDRHRENAKKVAKFLSKFKNIKLLYPYKKNSYNFRMWKK